MPATASFIVKISSYYNRNDRPPETLGKRTEDTEAVALNKSAETVCEGENGSGMLRYEVLRHYFSPAPERRIRAAGGCRYGLFNRSPAPGALKYDAGTNNRENGMSAWTIYSIGDAAFLRSVLNGAGMIFNSGLTGSLAAIALLLAVIFQGFLGSVRGSGISWGQLLMVFLLYLLFFVPRADVAIHDVYSGRIYPVSGVPLGIAAAGGIVSGMGRKTAETFETAFAVPEAEKRGFANSLMLLYRLREVIGKARLMADSPGGRGSFSENWKNYFKECTLIGIDLGALSPDKVFQAENVISGAAFLSDIYGTALNTGSGSRNLTCREAHQELSKYSAHVYMPLFTEKLRAASRSPGLPGDQDYLSGFESPGVPDIQSALDALGKSGVSVSNYMLSQVLLPIYREAAREKYQDEHAYSAAVMLSDAIQSRNAEMAAEQSLFFTSVRPFLTFFEALAYAISPFMCFALLLGTGGLAMMGRYLLLMIWIQLWQPLLSVVNLYILMSSRKALSAMAVPPESWEGIAAMHRAIGEYLGIGGMLAAGIPVLSTLVLYGGAQGLMSIAGRLSGKEHLNPQILAPRSASAPELLRQSPLLEMNRLSGGVAPGGQSFLPGVSFTGALDKAVSSQEAVTASSEQAFQESLTRARTASRGITITRNSLESSGEHIGSSSSEAAGIINSRSQEIASRLGLSQSETNAVRGSLGAMLSGLSAGAGNLASLSLSRDGSSGKASQISRLHGELQAVSRNSELRAAYNEAVSRDIARGVAESSSQGISEAVARGLQKSARKAVQDRQELMRLRSERTAFSAENRFDGGTVSRFASRNPAVMKRLMELNALDSSLSARTEELLPLMNSLLPDRAQAYAAAALTALNERNPVQGWELIKKSLSVKKGDFRDVSAAALPAASFPDLSGKLSPDMPEAAISRESPAASGCPGLPANITPRDHYEGKAGELRASETPSAITAGEDALRRDMLREPPPRGNSLHKTPGAVPEAGSGPSGAEGTPRKSLLSPPDQRVYEAFRKQEALSGEELRDFERAHPDASERFAMINRLKALAAGNGDALNMVKLK